MQQALLATGAARAQERAAPVAVICAAQCLVCKSKSLLAITWARIVKSGARPLCAPQVDAHARDLLAPHVSGCVAAQLFGLPANQMSRSLTNITVDTTALFLFNFQVCRMLCLTAWHETRITCSAFSQCRPTCARTPLFLRHPTALLCDQS